MQGFWIERARQIAKDMRAELARRGIEPAASETGKGAAHAGYLLDFVVRTPQGGEDALAMALMRLGWAQQILVYEDVYTPSQIRELLRIPPEDEAQPAPESDDI